MKAPLAVAAALLMGACTSYVDAYEEAVHDWEPTYCYQSIGGVQCFAKPYHRDEKRLVNYFGPHPSRYDRPEPPPPPYLVAPPPVDFYVRDPEPVPRPEPPMAMREPPANPPRPESVPAPEAEGVKDGASGSI